MRNLQIILRLCLFMVDATYVDLEAIDERSIKDEHPEVVKRTDLLPTANPKREKISLFIIIK